MRLLPALLLVVVTWAQAQNQTTGNLIYSTANPPPPGASYSWSGFQVTESQGGGLSGGNVPGYNTQVHQFMFGYAQGTIAYSMAVNQALSGTGIQVTGMQYGLQYFNQDYSRGTLSTTVTLQDKSGGTLQSYYHSLPQTTQGWTNFDQTKTFANPYALTNLGTVSMSFTGQDDRFWAGYWGPQFRGQYLRLTYGTDQCATNPLSSPECPGYAAAYLTQQCAISPLYNPTCPGYAAALFAQQCSANPLHDPACPGYQQAYFNQQCSLNALYDPACPGYQQAYFNQQCSLNGLYSQSCPNYGQAYARSQLLTSTTTSAAPSAATAAPPPSATSTTSPTSVTSVTSVIVSPAPVTATAAPSATTTTNTATTATTTTETRRNEREVSSATAGATGSTARARTEARAREVAAAASSAATLEAQAATQGLQIGLMAFVPGFDAYSAARIVDVNAQALARQYGRQPVDNRSVLRQLSGASDRLHQEMVDQQWRP